MANNDKIDFLAFVETINMKVKEFMDLFGLSFKEATEEVISDYPEYTFKILKTKVKIV